MPNYNNSQPTKRYQWKILPERMLKKNPTLCQYFVSLPLEMMHKQFPEFIVYHYRDGILLFDSNVYTSERLFEEESFA